MWGHKWEMEEKGRGWGNFNDIILDKNVNYSLILLIK